MQASGHCPALHVAALPVTTGVSPLLVKGVGILGKVLRKVSHSPV